jgi:hypothetical protein
MTTKVYFRNTKTGRRFEVVGVSPDKTEITLKGEYGKFTEPYDKERFKKIGYVLEKGDDHAEQS